MTEKQNTINLIFDYGNTLKKIATFKSDKLLNLKIYKKAPVNNVINYIEKIKKHNNVNVIISSVIDFPEKLSNHLYSNFHVLNMSHKIPLPIKNKYQTPNTLGNDRLAAAVAAYYLFPQNDVLIISAGSCLTFDFINKKGEYLGGAISPGIMMRFKALHNFTNKLPLIKKIEKTQLIGNSTEKSMLSGVINGILCEIDGIIGQYKMKYPNLKVIVSGGDMFFLQKKLKNNIFAIHNIVLKGLNFILNYNNYNAN
ncbi:MAG TPA: type III pantothenate kinase [Bacteroidales bacterium]|nr:type III pantothenate kinase [Bacteroidales bacterium]